MSILDEIRAYKLADVAGRKAAQSARRASRPRRATPSPPRGFAEALRAQAPRPAATP